ncbi:MAG: tRNA uridine-5-carboxymethylaminomethyl(34) synthesis GTPase MnmE [Candidatus Omnitrophota bacterium]
MKHALADDTIVAISTPVGEGGIGIVRLSGGDAIDIAKKIFISKTKKDISRSKTYTIHYGHAVDNKKKIIDEVILSVMKSPKSYTREDIVEINCHSGIVPLKKILNLALISGARLAEPGEFTKRAFLNGRVDILQAESVLDVIKAKTELSLKAALNNLEGHFSKKVNVIRDELLDALSDLEACIDFSEEDILRKNKKNILGRLKSTARDINKLIKTGDQGKILRQGIRTVICGSPNVGKSSLMNALLKESRAIVTHIPGTTRDTIEEFVNMKGLPIVLIDTAGINNTKCIIEREGIKRSRVSIENADLILFLLDHSRKIKKSDLDIMKKIINKENLIVVINKKDLKKKIDPSRVKIVLRNKNTVYVSALNMQGIDKLERMIEEKVFHGKAPSADFTSASNDRQLSLLRHGLSDIDEAIAALKKGVSLDCISIYIRSAIEKIGELTGHTVTESALDKIFSKFCIGK